MDKQEFLEEELSNISHALAHLSGFHCGLLTAGVPDKSLEALTHGIKGTRDAVSNITDFLEQEYGLYKPKRKDSVDCG